MFDDLRATIFFVKTVELGSFRGCAQHFGLSPSVISQHISYLEDKHRIALLYRTTRKLTLTDQGRHFFESAQQTLQSIDQTLAILNNNSQTPTGHLTLTMPAALIRSALMDQISRFAQTYEQVSLDIRFSDSRADMIGEGIDLALRVGAMKDSSLKSKKVSSIERKLVCARTYLKKYSAPKTLKDVQSWDWIKMKMMPAYRSFSAPNGQQTDLVFPARLEVDNVEAMIELTRQGLGLSTPPLDLIENDLAQGKLVEVLPDWAVAPLPVYAVWPPNGLNNPLTRLLLTYLAP